MEKNVIELINSYLSTVWNPIGLEENVIPNEYIEYADHIVKSFSKNPDTDSVYSYLKSIRTEMMLLPDDDHVDGNAAKYIVSILSST